jgi:hypothetical protein
MAATVIAEAAAYRRLVAYASRTAQLSSPPPWCPAVRLKFQGAAMNAIVCLTKRGAPDVAMSPPTITRAPGGDRLVWTGEVIVNPDLLAHLFCWKPEPVENGPICSPTHDMIAVAAETSGSRFLRDYRLSVAPRSAAADADTEPVRSLKPLLVHCRGSTSVAPGRPSSAAGSATRGDPATCTGSV